MVVNRVRRTADSGVATAVTSVIQNQKFKRMLVFGLRSLSDFCASSNQLCLENSLDALQRSVVPAIVNAVKSFGEDEDLVLSASHILATMVRGCIQEAQDPTLVKLLISQGGPAAIEAILSSCPADMTILENCFIFIEQLSASKDMQDSSIFVGGICKILASRRLAGSMASRVCMYFCHTCATPSGRAAVKEHSGISLLVQMCLGLSNDSEACATVENCLKACKCMVDAKQLDESVLEGVVTLIERFKESKLVKTRGSETIAGLISTAKLQKSLADLQTFEAGSPEHKLAINTLRSLSYVSTVAQELAKTGAIGLMIDLLNRASSQLSGNTDMADVVRGAARIIGAFANTTEYGKEVVQRGGVDALVSAMSFSMEHPACIVAISDALSQLLHVGVEAFVRSNAIAVALPILYQLSESEDVACAMMLYLVSASQIPDLESAFCDNKVVEILCTCSQYHAANLTYQMSLIQVLNRFTNQLKDLGTVYEYGGLAGISMALANNTTNEHYCTEVLGLLLTFAATPDAQRYMTADEWNVSDAILEVMLENNSNEKIIGLATRVLEVIVADSDVKRHADGLVIALENSRQDSELCYKKLAAINGLYRIARLRPIMASCGILPNLMTKVSDWIEGANFPNRNKLTRAAMQATILVAGNVSECQDMIARVSELACLPSVKRIIDLEGPEDNFLLHCTKALDVLCALERTYTRDDCVKTVESVLRVMKRYTDIRQAEASCMRTLLNFVEVTGKDGLYALESTGAIANIVAYLSKVPMYINCQEIGISLLLTCAKMDTSIVECLKRCNTFPLLRTLNRMHHRVKRLKSMLGLLMTILMPIDAIETELQQLILDLESGMAGREILLVHSTLVTMNQILVSKDAVRIAARINLVATVEKASVWVAANNALAESVPVVEEDDVAGKDLVDVVQHEVAQILVNVASTRLGLVYLTRGKFAKLALDIYTNLNAPTSSYVEDAAVSALEALVLLFQHDRGNVEDCVKLDFLARLCKTFTLHASSPPVFRSICRCLAVICSTPGRVEALIETADFVKLTRRLVGSLTEEDDAQTKINCALALSELLKIRDEKLLSYFGTTNIVPAFYDILEVHPSSTQLMELTAQSLCHMGTYALVPVEKLPPILAHVNKALTANKTHVNCVAALLELLVLLANSDNRDVLKQSGAMETVSDVMMLHYDVEAVTVPAGILFGILGAEVQIRALMRNVIDAIAANDDGMPQQVDRLCIRLAMYLLSPLDNRVEALQDTEEFYKSLNQCMAFAANNQNLMASASLVSKRLCDGVFDDFEDQFGAWAVVSSGHLQQLLAIVASEYGVSNVKYLCNCYRVQSACVVNVYTCDFMIDEARNNMPCTLSLLERYKANADVVLAIVEFLAYLATSPATATNVQGFGATLLLGSSTNFVALATELMTSHKTNDALVVVCLQLLAALARCEELKLDDATIGSTMAAAERVCIGDISETRRLAYMDFAASFLSRGYADVSVLSSIMMLLQSSAADVRGSAGMLKAFAAILLAAASSGHVEKLLQAGNFKMLLELLDECQERDLDAIVQVLRALLTCIEARPESAAALLKESIAKTLLVPPKPNDVESVKNTLTSEYGHVLCDVFLAGTRITGVGRILDTVDSVGKVLGSLMLLAKESGDTQLEQKVNGVLDAIAKDRPVKKTCQTVYASLEARKIQGKTLNVHEALDVLDDAKFLLDTMAEYNHACLTLDKEEAKDHIYGSMALSLLAIDVNIQTLIEHGLMDVFTTGLTKQKNVRLLNEVVAMACSACHSTTFVARLLSKRECVQLIGAYLDNVHYQRGIDFDFRLADGAAESPRTAVVAKIESGRDSTPVRASATATNPKNPKAVSVDHQMVLVNAMLLIERTAINRKIYLHSKVIETIVDVWNCYDSGKYTETKVLRQTFRSLRKIVAEGHLDVLLRCHMIARIKHIFKTVTDYTVIPDALFLAGSLAVVTTIKTQICQEGLIDAIIDLMRQHVGNPDSPNAIVTNTCLALANACIGHKQSVERFVSLKGPELNVTVLRQYKGVYEVTNGASILLCNLLYKNDLLKEYYGKIGAPAALVGCLGAFAGSSEALAIRCIESLFKAISNLALYAGNVTFFLDAGIEASFQAWLNELDVEFSDAQLKVGLQTLSNLVMENKPEHMTKFGVVLPAVLKVLAQDRDDSRVALLLFDILSSLCRLEDNGRKFLQLGGVEMTMQTMRKKNYDYELITLGIHLLAMQTVSQEGVIKLLELDIYGLLLSTLVFEGQGTELFDVLIASLRCIRRLLTSDEMVYLLCSQDGLAILVDICQRYQNQPGIVFETLRLLVGMLDFTKPTETNAAASWENLGMENDDIESILKVVCSCGNQENCLRLARLQCILASVASYFLSCQLGAEVLLVNGLETLIYNLLTNFGNNLNMILLVTVLLENCLLAPADVRNNLVSKELVKKYKEVAARVPNKTQQDKNLKQRCNLLADALAAGEAPKLEGSGKFDFTLSEWNVDPYPHGVHDLPENVKAALRKGERIKAFINDAKIRVGIRWRASQDLGCFEWGPEEEDYPYRVAIRRIRNIARGLKHPILEAANQKEPRKVTANNCFCIFGSATEDFPDGLVLPIKCKSQKERDAVVELLVQWRDAASYNY